MSNPSKQKGTGAETELLRLLETKGLSFVRMEQGSPYDLTNADPKRFEIEPLQVLATRPDRGRWLATLRIEDLVALLLAAADSPGNWGGVWETHIEVKRYSRFSLHTIFEGKFGR